MTNSLRKDSHIALGFSIPKNAVPYYNSTGARVRKQNNSVPVSDSVSISVNKPAEINFCGLSSRTLANDAEFKMLVEAAKQIVGSGKKEFKGVMQLMRDAADYLLPQAQKEGKGAKPASDTVKQFVDSNKSQLQKMVDKAKELTKEDNFVMIKDKMNPDNDVKIPKMITDPNDKSKKIIELRANPEELRDEILKSIVDATDGTSILDKNPWYKGRQSLNYFLQLAEKNNVAFSATFALFLTCLIRPTAILALPGDKKHNDDKKYAAAHSIASGVIGFVVATAVSNPVADALKKVLEEPAEYIKVRAKNKYKTEALYESAKKLAEERANYLECSMKMNKASNMWVTRGVDILMAVPKACITIALIPPILKYIFGWEKKKHATTPINIQTNYNQNQANEKRPRNIAGGGLNNVHP